MLVRSLFAIFLIAAVGAVVAAPAPPEGPRQIRLAPPSTVKHVAAFRYRLLPDPREVTHGNAAPLWRLAGEAYRETERKFRMKNREFDWSGQTPLKNLPRKEVRDFLAHYTVPLRLARQAAHRDHCDWELPPITFQGVGEYLPLDWLQNCRFLAAFLCIQYRLQLAEGQFEDAAETLQIGFALARHLYEGEMLMQILVGIAIDAILFGRVEEWIQTPGSPNLYWALTALPGPRANLRRCFVYEMNSLYRSFPKLRRLDRETLTGQQADNVVNEMIDSLNRMIDSNAKNADTFKKQIAAIREETKYPQARKRLLDLGRSTKEVDAMPKAQVVLLWYVDQYDRAWEKVLAALTVPTWQAMPLMETANQELGASDNIFLTLLGPVVDKTWMACVRFERQLAGLRGAEALRVYAAAHRGKPPAQWSDITSVPLPIDPLTGKGFDGFYQVTGDRGILEIPPPPPPGMPAFLGRRYVLEPR